VLKVRPGAPVTIAPAGADGPPTPAEATQDAG
jgi:hypothetical protein